jgi:hypothetical protein
MSGPLDLLMVADNLRESAKNNLIGLRRTVSVRVGDCLTQRHAWPPWDPDPGRLPRTSPNSSWHRTCWCAPSVRYRRSHDRARHTGNAVGLLVVVSVSAVAAGCASSPVLSTSPSPTKCQVTLSTSTLSVDVAGATGSIVINTERECAWEGATAVDWIALTSSATGRGTGQLDFRVLANPDSLARQAAITVSDQRLEIKQGAAPCVVTVGTSAFTLGADGGDQAVPVTAPRGCSWTVTSAANWISVPVDSGSGSARLAFTVQANPGAPRSGRLTVADQTITIAQSTGIQACSYSISPVTQVIAALGGPAAVAVTAASGCAWSATSNASWISVQAGSTGAGNGSVTIVVTPNTGPARSGTALVAGQTVTINQAQSAPQPPPPPPPPENLCSYAISPGVASIGASAGSATVAITAPSGCSWTALSQTAWIAVISGASGAGSAAITVSISANPGAARSGIVSIAGHTFTVNQSANCSYSINPANAAIAAGGGAGPGIAVTATAGCAWTSSSNAAWISVTSGSAGTGNGSVTFTVAANAGASRSGTVTIAGQTLTVNQAVGCSYSINPASASIKRDGGNGPAVTVTATAGCSWTAASNDAWITVTAGASGTGNGNVAFKVSKNDGAQRTGTLTIAGQTFTVTQEKH